MVNASTPMLKTNAARQCRVTNRRMWVSVTITSEVCERHAAGEGEIDEVPIDGLAVRGNSSPTQPTVRLAVDQMRIVERVDQVAEQPGERERDDDQHLGQRLRVVADRFGADRHEQHRHDDRREDQQQRAVGVIRLGMLADDARLAGAEQAARRPAGTAIAARSKAAIAPSAQRWSAALAIGNADQQDREEQQESPGCDDVADVAVFSHGRSVTNAGRSSSER